MSRLVYVSYWLYSSFNRPASYESLCELTQKMSRVAHSVFAYVRTLGQGPTCTSYLSHGGAPDPTVISHGDDNPGITAGLLQGDLRHKVHVR